MTIRAVILGCGSSGGVPRVGGDWGVCDPNQPKNRRSRCSLYVEYWEGPKEPPAVERTAALIDTSPDLREQCLKADVKRLDALLYTHDHADQSHGIDDLRAIAYRMRKRIPTYMDAHTKEHVYERFKYCFEMPEGRVHPPILELQELIKGEDRFDVSGPGGVLSVDVLELSHGPTPSFGFILDSKLAYTPDVWDMADAGFEALTGVDTWILDALRYNDHPTHAHADKALSWLVKTQAKQGILTNLHIDMDYHTLKNELFGNVRPSYDGMEIRL
ncbi:MBL fold metallo-hydrolase [Hellea balneolensis]|uniref:MBL fold metallo-hydrolase n=1 Tax=Hellea balneolensis TaxID=287478 RepID=UPI00041CD960|nr:MBL fold metallo-hydrolase [Hellea balneolensis]